MAAEKAVAADDVGAVNDPEQPEMANDLEKPELERPNEELQRGVQDMEALTLSWSKTALIGIFANIWGLYLVNAFQSSILYDLIPYAASDFGSHSLLNVIYIVSNAVTAALFIPLAKIVDVWGRAEGFLLMILFATIGLVVMAASNSLVALSAGYVFYSIGTSGMTYCVDVLTADASKLKNRGLAYAFTSSPYIITAFAGPKASSEFYANIGWRWGFGAFSIIFPIVSAPLYFILKFYIRKAKVQGTLVEGKPKRTLLQTIWFYVVEFDLAGVVLFSTGLVVFLLPFDIASEAPYGWGTAYIIAMLVTGLVIIVIFVLYEALLAPTPMLNFQLLSNRTVIGACLIDATYQISYYCWNNYFTSFLQVVNNLGIAEAGYINNTFNVVSGLLLLLTGYLIRRTGRFKWLLYIGVPLYIFALGLMIYFRRPNQSVGYLVFCEVLISIGGSVFIIVEQLAILAAVDHQHVASALSLLYVVGTVGGSLGATISGAIWTNTFEKALESYLPESSLENLVDIYGDLETQLSYPVGSATRLAIQKAYGYAQTRMLAAGTGVMGLGLIWMLLIRNIDVRKVTQVKGMVF
ncbi:major facilitator superfamily domain-containing protein [Xylaria bambusicola]|uniref:major facilitator superfamily domain-containing protein n=1 Tax=Xylaria bambusicola TaxID=326684 RepID=UPI002007235B|nr:major facilitator superfamily domain-containing protein [Xylaria bambusicola]KAI0517343.1 major facilitator superfamily domain-containing protein [Xylaria bambusicola]